MEKFDLIKYSESKMTECIYTSIPRDVLKQISETLKEYRPYVFSTK